MQAKMSVLFISPMEHMRKDVLAIGREYPGVDLTVEVGNEALGRQIAEMRYSQKYDCIISRGNTAAMIRSAVSVPVIDVKVTLYDVLESLSAVESVPDRVAAVGYNSVVSGMGYLNRFLPFELEVFGFDRIEQSAEVFGILRSKGIRVIVCDAITHQLALKEGFEAYILCSSADSIRYAFEQAVQLFQSNQTILEENQLLRRLVSANSESEMVVYAWDGRLYYSSLDQQETIILEDLREHLPDFETHDRFRMVKQHGDYLYRVSARKVSSSGRNYYAYFLSRRIVHPLHRHKSIHYFSEADIRREMRDSVFGIANVQSYYLTEMNRALSQRNPVLIYGEVGVGKNHLAELIYLNGNARKNPFVLVDCSLISKRTWDFFIHKDESPLCDNGNTLFIKNIDALDDRELRQLLAVIVEGDVAKRNRLIFSCSALRSLSSVSGLPVVKVVNQLECLTINMSPLRGQYATIENSVRLMLDNYRLRTGIPVGPVKPEAMTALLHHNWPQNFDQLIRVVHKAASAAGSGPITGQMVEDILTAELNFIQGETPLTGNTLLNLSQPLEQIDSDIIRIVLEQNHGNQSVAAKSLGISRTTLWRMLKAKPGEPSGGE